MRGAAGSSLCELIHCLLLLLRSLSPLPLSIQSPSLHPLSLRISLFVSLSSYLSQLLASLLFLFTHYCIIKLCPQIPMLACCHGLPNNSEPQASGQPRPNREVRLCLPSSSALSSTILARHGHEASRLSFPVKYQLLKDPDVTRETARKSATIREPYSVSPCQPPTLSHLFHIRPRP
jgi:hypothetical protein